MTPVWTFELHYFDKSLPYRIISNVRINRCNVCADKQTNKQTNGAWLRVLLEWGSPKLAPIMNNETVFGNFPDTWIGFCLDFWIFTDFHGLIHWILDFWADFGLFPRFLDYLHTILDFKIILGFWIKIFGFSPKCTRFFSLRTPRYLPVNHCWNLYGG